MPTRKEKNLEQSIAHSLSGLAGVQEAATVVSRRAASVAADRRLEAAFALPAPRGMADDETNALRGVWTTVHQR